LKVPSGNGNRKNKGPFWLDRKVPKKSPEGQSPNQGMNPAFVREPGTESVLAHNSCLDHLTVLPRGNWVRQIQFIRFIRSCRFDCVIDVSDGDRSALLTVLSGARVKIGFNHEGRWRGKVYSYSVKEHYGTMHMLDYHAQSLIPLGMTPRVCAPELSVSDEESQAAEQILSDNGLQNTKWVMLP